MTVKYVVSIEGRLLNFDADRKPTDGPPSSDGQVQSKLQLKLIPPERKPAADSAWDDALACYSKEQREAAEISEAIDDASR